MKIYTKTGDKGQTGLYGGTKVSKSNLRIESYGTVDELNSWIGLLAELPNIIFMKPDLQIIQHVLFDIGALLACDSVSRADKLPQVVDQDITKLEDLIDKISADLPVLKAFVLPGGSHDSAQAQIARTVCRRAERQVVGLSEQQQISNSIIVYLNRLSDLLFVIGRMACLAAGAEEIIWQSRHKK